MATVTGGWTVHAGQLWLIGFMLGMLSACGDSGGTRGGGSSGDASLPAAGSFAAKPPEVDAGAASGPAAGRLAPPPPAIDAGPASGSGAGSSADAGGFEACSAVDLEATVRQIPVDIVWAIDSSGSMRNELDAIQQSLNIFAEKFADAAIDVHVVVITEGNDFEVPAPLGIDAKRFLFLDRDVGSDEALETFIDRFDDYSAFLRPGAKLELIAVTDDESDITAGEFLAGMRALGVADFRLHAIASERVDDDACDGARSPGDEYYAAAAQTSGLTFSICNADSAALFAALGDGLIESAPFPCELDVPAPPAGRQFDPNLINVVHKAVDTTTRQVIPRANSGSSCGELGWFYDDPSSPSLLTLCPRTCESLGAGDLNITFGCRTMLLL